MTFKLTSTPHSTLAGFFGAVWIDVRAEARTRWMGLLGVALLVGIGGGAVMTAVAGARRTDSGITRVTRDQRPPTIYVNPDGNDLAPDFVAAWAAVDKLPGVRTIAAEPGVIVAPVDAKRRPDVAVAVSEITVAAGDPAAFREVDRPHIVQGRMPAYDRENEVYINEVKARRQHLHVGSRLHLGVYAVDDFTSAEAFPPARWVQDFTVVGIGESFEEAGRSADDPNLEPITLFTPAFNRRLRGTTPPYLRKVVVLDSARAIPAFESRVRALFRNVDYADAGGNQVPATMDFQESALNVARIRRAVRPYVLALWLFAALTAIAALAVLGQAVARAMGPLREERERLSALGFSRRQFLAAAATRGFLIGIVGTVIGMAIAFAGSSVMPIGPLRSMDPSRGAQFDFAVFGAGCALVVGLCVLGALLAARRRAGSRRQVSAAAERLARAGAPVPVVTGVRFAFDRGRQGDVPVRSTLTGLTIGIAALVATLLYGGSLTRFTSSPVRYGWPWGYQITVDDPNVSYAQAAQRLTALPDVATVTRGLYSQFTVGGHSIAAVGIDPKPGVPSLPLLSGRAPRADDEVVFGAVTLRSIGAHVGSRVSVLAQSTRRELRVVGSAVFPRFAAHPGSEPTGLGIGAATTAHAIESMKAQFGPPFVLVRLHSTSIVSPKKLLRVTRQGPLSGSVVGPQRPNDVLSYDRLSTTPLILAGLLTVLAIGSAIHLLVSGVRSRRRDLAVLKAIGLTRRQARAAVLSQATLLALLALAVALPAGLFAARGLWSLTAHWLGIAADPTPPTLVLSVVTLATLIAANLIAFAPALIAVRIRPAAVLRAE